MLLLTDTKWLAIQAYILKASTCLGNFVPNNKNKYKPANMTGAQITDFNFCRCPEELSELEKYLEVIKTAQIFVHLVRKQNVLTKT